MHKRKYLLFLIIIILNFIFVPEQKAISQNEFIKNGVKKTKEKVQKFIDNYNKNRIIKNGVYVIKPYYNTKKAVEVSGGSHSNFANIQISDNQNKQNQKFRIEQISNTGEYKIISIESGKALDVYSGSQKSGTNVDQYDWNNSDAQKWSFYKVADNVYKIKSKCNGLYLDVYGKGSNNGTNVDVYADNNSEAQMFYLEQVQIYPEGEYEIEAKLKSDMILDVNGGSKANAANIQMWESSNVEQQKFILSYTKSDNTYTIKAKHSNKVITTNNNGSVYQYDYTGEDGQKWYIKEAGNGYYYISSKLQGSTLTIQNTNCQNGTIIKTENLSGKDTQKFKFFKGIRTYYEKGNYGKSGLAVIGDPRGSNLEYYKFGKGKNVLYTTFSIHGYEDSYAKDGAELTYIAEEFKKYLINSKDAQLFTNWTIYIFPDLNPDGQKYGWTNNGPGRTSLVSAAPNHQGIDLNRNWQPDGESYVTYTEERNYNGTAGFQAYETKALREFLLKHKSSNGQTLLIDLHGWLDESIGDNDIGLIYRKNFNLSNHIPSYGRGYLINWARKSLTGTKVARSALIELPEVKSHTELVNKNYANKYIKATMETLNTFNK